MKNCNQCGAQMQDGDKFCMNCGSAYVDKRGTTANLPQQPASQTAPDSSEPVVASQITPRLTPPPRPKRGSWFRTKLILGAILAIILVAGGFWGWKTYVTEAQAERKLDLAVKYLSDNNYEQAILAFNDAINIDPKEAKGYQGLAKTYTLQGNYDSAKDTYEKGITAVTTPQNKQILQLGLAGMYIDQNKLTDAEQAYSQIINASQNCLEAYWGLAMVYNQQGDGDKAEATLRQAVEKNPKEYRGYNTLALFLSQKNKKDEALDNLIQALALEVNQQEAYLLLDSMYQKNWTELRSKAGGQSNQTVATMLEFYSYYAAGDYSHAISTYQNQLSTQNGNHKAMIMAAICMVKNGDKALSESLIKQIKISKLNPWLLGDLGRYFLAAGDQAKAREYAIKALRAQPTNLDAIALLQAINANDPDAELYVAEALLYNWRPIHNSAQILLNWDYVGDAYSDTNQGYIALTKPEPFKLGQIWLKQNIQLPYTISFRYKVGAGGGALGKGDGFVCMFNKDRSYTPANGGYLGFDSGKGYGVEFDAFRNDWDPSDSHIALIKDSVRNHLAYVNTNITKDNLWHNVMLEITGNTIDVFVDNEKLLSWNGQFDNTYSGVGISGATGNANDWHLISIVKIQSGISN